MAVAASTGCQREIADHYVQENDILNVYAMIEGAEDTKTSLNDIEVFWNSSDRIAVFLKNSLRKRFDVSSESVGSKEGTFVYDSDYIVIGKEVTISNNVAYYPFAEVTCTLGSSAYSLENISLPLTQYYSPSSFGQDAFPMVAVTVDTDDLDFAFKNLCGVLEFQLKGIGTIRSVAVKGNSEEILAGKAIVTAAYGKNPEISLLPDGSKTVTLDCGDSGVALQNDTPTSFFIVLPPVSFDNGFTVTVTDAAGTTAEYSTTKKNIVHRSGILRMPEKEYVAERVPQEDDYIDEYGINHGSGTEIDGVVWAPVNCGYHKDYFKYGKLYQWGRKYGQGYQGDIYDVNCNLIGTYSDAIVSIVKSGPVSLSTGQAQSNANYFYTSNSSHDFDWLSCPDKELWNLGTESEPIKTEYDPCPEGWRVPTKAELKNLTSHKSPWTTNDGQVGYWFSGSESYSSSVSSVFFPAAGYSIYYGKEPNRGDDGHYWSSCPNKNNRADYLIFYDNRNTWFYDGRANGFSVRCVKDNSELVPVESIELSQTTLSIYSGSSETLIANIAPYDANHHSALWWAADESIAAVNQDGIVTAVSSGVTTITAMAGMQIATCEVTVIAKPLTTNYIDEYGIDQGPGIMIGETTWAPVNCGYHATDYPYGKLYQWGRKYGQGYSGGLLDVNLYYIGEVSDATVPRFKEGGVSLASGQPEDDSNVFFIGDSENGDWLYQADDTLWNIGTESDPVKTEYDPCPDGWRVPTYAELDELSKNRSSWTTNDKQQPGYWFSGVSSYTETVPQVFFPAAGNRRIAYGGITSDYRGGYGSYWSSRPYSGRLAYSLDFNGIFDYFAMNSSARAYGFSVRCVQENQ